jgi:hypothetical protein
MANLLSTTVNGQLNTGNVIDLGYTVNGSIATTAFRGINFHSFGDLNYYIGKPAGDWTQPLDIHFYTGIRLKSHSGYGGTKFINLNGGSTLMSVGDGGNNINVYTKITSSISSGTVLSHGSMDDAIGWNSSYGTYIGSTVGGTYYIYGNGRFYDNGTIRTLIHSGNIGSQSVSYATTANVANFFGGFTAYGLVEEARGVHSVSDFPNGTLVTTDIAANEFAGDSFVMEVSGKSYGSGTPFKLAMEGYLYANTIINVSAMSYGSYFPAPVKVMNLDGTLAFWWPRGSYWNSFEVHVRAAGGESWNRVTGISDSVDPASATKKISITPVQVIHTNNIGSQSVSYATSAGTSTTSTHLSSRTDSEWYNVIWGAGNPSYMYSSDSVRIRSSDGALRANIYYDNQDTSYYVDPNGNSYLSTLRVADASNGVSMHVGVGSTLGVLNDNARKYLVVSADYYPHMAIVARYANNSSHGAVFSFVGSEGGNFRQWNLGIANSDPFLFSIGYNNTGDANPHYGVGDAWSGNDAHHARLSIDRSGNTKIRGMLYVNGTSGGISTGSAVIHAGNIGSQSVNYANSAGSLTSMNISQFTNNSGYITSSASISGNAASATFARRIAGPERIGFNVGGNASTFYPIAIFTGAGSTESQYSEFIIERGGYEDPGFSGIGFSTFNARFTFKPTGWGYGANYFHLEQLTQTATMLGDYLDQYQSAQAIIWLRGATRYNIYSVYGSIDLLFANESGTSYTMAYGTYDPIDTPREKAITNKYYEGSVRYSGSIHTGSNTVIHSGNIASQSVNYATNSTRLYASDSPYNFGGAAPYYMYMTYDGSRWLLQVTPGTPAAVRVSYADSAGSSSTSSVAGTVTHNASRTDSAWYNAIWGAGTPSPLYSCDAVQIQSSTGAVRANIYYDNQDTAYYVDPNSLSRIDRLQVVGGWGGATPNDGQINIRGSYPSITFRNTISGNMWLRHMDGSGDIQHYFAPSGVDATDWSIKHTMFRDGTFFSAGSMRAPIFYDSNDTNYYVDPNSTSVLNALTLNGRLNAYSSIVYLNEIRFTNTAGSTQSDPYTMRWISEDSARGAGLSWLEFQLNDDSNEEIRIYGNSCAGFGCGTYSDNLYHRFNASGYAWHQSTVEAPTVYGSTIVYGPTILVNNHSDNTKGYRIHNTSGSSVSAMFTNSSNQLVIGAGAFDRINLNKNVYLNGTSLGINVTPSATVGRIDAANDIVAYSSSDERLKYNITPIENAIDKVKSLTGVEFDWKPEYKHAHGYEGHDTGIIAQQVQEVIPSAVRTNDTGFLAVRYEKLIGLLVEGMKEQQAQIEELKAKLDGIAR